MNLKDLSKRELDKLRVDVANEQERRTNLEAIPGQIRSLTDKYVEGGGSKSDLTDAIETQSDQEPAENTDP